MISEFPDLSVYSTAQIADYPTGATFGPRRVHDYELIWLLRGSARWTRRDLDEHGVLGPEETRVLRPNELALARRGSRDAFAWDQRRSTRHAFVHFSIRDPSVFGPETSWPTVQTMAAVPVLEGLCSYLLELSGLASDEAWDRSDHVVGLILEVLIKGPRPTVSDAWPESLQEMIGYVRRDWSRHGMRGIDVAELARAAHLSPGHLHRLFRERCGCGPAHALELVRLARAAISLQRSNTPLAAVAHATGFANPYHFSRRFSAAYGCPPGAFRRREEVMDPLGPVRQARLSAVAQRLL